MSIQERIVYDVICDGDCGRYVEGFGRETEDDILSDAADEGWHIAEDEHLCPDCKDTGHMRICEQIIEGDD